MTEPANSFQTLLPEHVLRRREKGEASFLPSLQVTGEGRSKRHKQRKRDGGGERGKKKQREEEKMKEGKHRGKRDTEVGHEKMWD